MRRLAGFWIPLALGLAAPALAQEPRQPAAGTAVLPTPRADSLDELLTLIGNGMRAEGAEARRLEERFRRDRAGRAVLLEEARALRESLETRSQELESTFQQNERTLADLQQGLSDGLGDLGELFGVVRQVSTDAAGQMLGSLTSAQLDGRQGFLEELGRSRELPSVEKLERLWYELAREMTEQGRVVRFRTPVLTAAGDEVERDVIRAGVFTAVSGGEYLLWEQSRLRELTRQPPSRYVETVAPFERARDGLQPLAIDPSRGSLLSVLIDTKSLPERLPEGGPVGYTIVGLGLMAALLAIGRWVMVTLTARQVAAQQRSDSADEDNPLGRVMAVYEANRNADPETLELKLDEAVMRETGRLERFIWLVKVVSVVAPLLGLLGTVTGMIRTFQAITLFGAGDPKMMAGGISEALVTTMLGLTVAIPLVLLHALLASSTKGITEVLEQQSAGLVARQAERAEQARA